MEKESFPKAVVQGKDPNLVKLEIEGKQVEIYGATINVHWNGFLEIEIEGRFKGGPDS
jgi:hypothetical protein